ncbi:hypothetical protein [Paenibacillus jiagnxiensis]|uniref:hypothetical protein n=1 Tax=Paenibacillus jiagnxiensis TaxID=3228926 RepID=UPI0033A79E46
MSGKLLVELDDLRRAERELTRLLEGLRADEIEAKSLYKRLEDWKGNGANTTREQIEAFFSGLSQRIQSIELQKQSLLQYIEAMVQADQGR